MNIALLDKEDLAFKDDVLRTLAIEEIKTSLFKLCTKALGYTDINERTHGDIIKTLESDSKRKLICVPRGCLKSTIACISYPIWLLINNPNLRILIDSELFTNSKNFLREIKGHFESKLLTDLFGNFKGECWNESEIILKQRTRVFKEASLSCAGIGTKKISQHYDVIIHDDMNSPENTNSPESAAKVIDHYKYNHSILEPGGIIVVIGTRYSENDLIGHILRTEIDPQDAAETGM